jgi:hypothetical protein
MVVDRSKILSRYYSKEREQRIIKIRRHKGKNTSFVDIQIAIDHYCKIKRIKS